MKRLFLIAILAVCGSQAQVTPVPNGTFAPFRTAMNANFSSLDNVSRSIFDYSSSLTGNGSTDDTTAFQAALTACPAGVTLELGGPEHIFKLTSIVNLKSNCNLHASGAYVKQVTANTAWGDLGGKTNVAIRGLTWGTSTGGGLIESSAADHITLSDNFCVISGGTFPSNNCIYWSSALSDSQVTNNAFTTTGYGVYGFTSRRVKIASNRCTTVVGDCIYVTNTGGSTNYGYGLLIQGNTSTDGTRMFIEVQGGYLDATQIIDNRAGEWNGGAGSTSFCISLATAGGGDAGDIRGNVCLGNAVTPTCIEVVQSNTTVGPGNYCRGFISQVLVNNASDVLVIGNDLYLANTSAIATANTATSPRLRVLNNLIREPQTAGMDASFYADGMTFSGNSVIRTPGIWAGDATTDYNGLVIGALAAPITVSGNTFTLLAGTVPAGFNFFAIRPTGQTAHSFYSLNTITNLTTGLFGTGFLLNSATTELNLTHLRDNRLSGLAAASNAPGGSTVIASCNVALNSTPSNLIVTACP